MKKFFIVAGEPSGDLHAARLMNALREIFPDAEFIGIGGKKMSEAGLQSLVPLEEISVVGFWEVAKRYGFFKKLLERCKGILAAGKIDAFIPVDYPGFNLRLAAFARELNIPVTFYIAPQLWAWGANRAKKLSGLVDLLLVVFPFEVDFFRNFGIRTEFVGHPLLDDPAFEGGFLPLAERARRVAFLPGSRRQELAKHLPVVAETISLLRKADPGLEFGIAQSPLIGGEFYKEYLGADVSLWSDSRKLMRSSRAGMVKTGTSNLEAALCGMPFTMMYKTSFFSYHISKYLVTLPYISLVNILAGRFVVPELIQKEASPKNIAAEILSFLSDGDKAQTMQNDFAEIRRTLGEYGASRRAAEAIAAVLGQ